MSWAVLVGESYDGATTWHRECDGLSCSEAHAEAAELRAQGLRARVVADDDDDDFEPSGLPAAPAPAPAPAPAARPGAQPWFIGLAQGAADPRVAGLLARGYELRIDGCYLHEWPQGRHGDLWAYGVGDPLRR